MNIIVCLDDHGGMSFFGRRQSMDRVLREKAVALAGENKLWMSPYSANQFTDSPEQIVCQKDFLSQAAEDTWCFLETDDIGPWKDSVRRIAVFRWNRLYPSDRRFPEELLEKRKLLHQEEFSGSSHDRITLEVFDL